MLDIPSSDTAVKKRPGRQSGSPVHSTVTVRDFCLLAHQDLSFSFMSIVEIEEPVNIVTFSASYNHGLLVRLR
jgi:hypothetical protein